MKRRLITYALVGAVLALAAPEIRDAAAFVLAKNTAANAQLIFDGAVLAFGCL